MLKVKLKVVLTVKNVSFFYTQAGLNATNASSKTPKIYFGGISSLLLRSEMPKSGLAKVATVIIITFNLPNYMRGDRNVSDLFKKKV